MTTPQYACATDKHNGHRSSRAAAHCFYVADQARIAGKTNYAAIAAECVGEPGCITWEDLDAASVESARAWARRNHQAWPPAHVNDGWQVTIRSIRLEH